MNAPQITLLAPCKGTIASLDDVPDEVFAHRMVGDGVAILPEEGVFYAPMGGRIEALFPTGHALGIRSPEGLEVLLHIGIETVSLGGKGFTLHVEKGQTVEGGDRLIEVDLNYVKNHAPSLLSPVVLTSRDRVERWALLARDHVDAKVPFMEVFLKK